ncbi:MAG: hypothetical protein RR396_06210 [Clostridiales bacterium]
MKKSTKEENCLYSLALAIIFVVLANKAEELAWGILGLAFGQFMAKEMKKPIKSLCHICKYKLHFS